MSVGWHATICGSDLLYIKQPRMHIDACHGCSIHEVVGEVVDVVGNSAFAKGTMVGLWRPYCIRVMCKGICFA